MDHKKQPVADWQHSHTMSSSVPLSTISSHPLKQHSLPQPHNSLCPGYAMLKPVTPRGCPGPTGIHLNECRPLLLSLDSQTGTAASQMSECTHARTHARILNVIGHPGMESRGQGRRARSPYRWCMGFCSSVFQPTRRPVHSVAPRGL